MLSICSLLFVSVSPFYIICPSIFLLVQHSFDEHYLIVLYFSVSRTDVIRSFKYFSDGTVCQFNRQHEDPHEPSQGIYCLFIYLALIRNTIFISFSNLKISHLCFKDSNKTIKLEAFHVFKVIFLKTGLNSFLCCTYIYWHISGLRLIF